MPFLTQAGAAIGGGRGCCLTFHRAATSADWEGLPNRDFYLDIGYLERLVRHLLSAGWDIVSMDEAVARTGRPGFRRFVNFSIDDCYRDTAELVVPLFRRLGVPVTLFVTSGIPDGTMVMRDAGLETLLADGRDSVTEGGRRFPLATAAQRRAAYAALSAGWDHPDGDAQYRRFCVAHGRDPDELARRHRITWDMLDALRDDPLVGIEAHTVSHPRLSEIDPATAVAELAGSRDRLRRRLGVPARHFAFPFGRVPDCGARNFALAEATGYVSASTTTKGLVRPGTDAFRMPRNTLNGRHRKLVWAYAHLTGLSGVVAKALRRG